MELTVENLTVARGGIAVLEGISLSLNKGQGLVLRGPNGIGKTTLLRTIAGLQPPRMGQVNVPENAIAYAAHSDGIKFQLTVTENLRFWANIFGTHDITAALNTFDLTPLKDRLAGTLSAGQKRKLGLARMMVTGRPIWILDEPTVSLDVEATSMFARMIQTHLGQGGIALMATHIDLGLDLEILDVGQYKAKAPLRTDDDDMEGFL